MKRIVQAATLLTLLSIISKILGFIRVRLMAGYYGTGMDADAFTLAFMILEFFRNFIAGGTLVSAIIPVYRSLVVKEQRDDYVSLGLTLLTIVSAVMIGAIVVWFAVGGSVITWIGDLFLSDKSDETLQLAISLGNIMIFAIFSFGIVSVGMAILNSFQHFLSPAVTPSILNAVMIVVMVMFHERWGIYSMAVGLLVGTTFQVFILIGPLYRRLGSLKPRLSASHHQLREVWQLLKPLLWGLLAYRFIFIANKFFALPLGKGTVAALGYAEYLVMSFVDILGLSLAIALYPTLSEFITRKMQAEYCRTAFSSLRMTWFVALPIAGVLMVFRIPLTRLLFEHGEFDRESTLLTASILLFLALTVLFQSANYVLKNILYADRRMAVTTLISIVSLAINFLLIVLLIGPLGARGIALAITIAYALQAFSLLVYFMYLNQQFPRWTFLVAIVHILVMTATALAVGSGFHFVVEQMFDPSGVIGQALSLGFALAVSSLLYIALGWLAGIEEVRKSLSILATWRQSRRKMK